MKTQNHTISECLSIKFYASPNKKKKSTVWKTFSMLIHNWKCLWLYGIWELLHFHPSAPPWTKVLFTAHCHYITLLRNFRMLKTDLVQEKTCLYLSCGNSFEYALVSALQLRALSSYFIKYSWVCKNTKCMWVTKPITRFKFIHIYLTLTRFAKTIS